MQMRRRRFLKAVKRSSRQRRRHSALVSNSFTSEFAASRATIRKRNLLLLTDQAPTD